MQTTKEKTQTAELCSVCYASGHLDDGEICGACEGEGHLNPERFLFNEKEHIYTLDGHALHGTTTVLAVIAKPALIPWAAKTVVDHIKENADQLSLNEGTLEYYKVTPKLLEEAKVAHTKKKEKAGKLGTDVHKEIEEWINACIKNHGGNPVVMGVTSPQTTEFIQWAIVRDVKFLASEKRLYSETLWTAGTADFVCEIDGKLYIGDVKTSSGIYPEYYIQASAYAKMAEEMKLYKNFGGVIIVNVKKTGGIEVKENFDIEGNFECFKACLTIYRQLKAIK